jgi:hypothetical protein
MVSEAEAEAEAENRSLSLNLEAEAKNRSLSLNLEACACPWVHVGHGICLRAVTCSGQTMRKQSSLSESNRPAQHATGKACTTRDWEGG